MRLGTIRTIALLALSILVASSVAHGQESIVVPDPRPRPPPFFPPPQPPACPPVPPGSGGERAPHIVSISDGTTITAEDIWQFNATWMTPDICDGEVGLANVAFSIRKARWETAERMTAMTRMHELTYVPGTLTPDLRYLNHLRQLIELALFFRDDHYPGNPDPTCQRCEPTPIDDFRGGHVAGWGGIQYDNFSGISEDTTGVLAYPIATFARIVAEDPSLQADYGPDAVRYANAAMETMWALMPQMNIQSVGNLFWGYLAIPDSYRTKLTPVCHEQACRDLIDSAGLPLEYNGNGAFMMTLIELWRTLDSSYYRSYAPQTNQVELTRALIPLLVSRFQRFFVDHLRTGLDDLGRGSYFAWNYSDGGPRTHAEDIAHGSLDMRYLDVLRRNLDRLNAAVGPSEPIALDNSRLALFANTFLLNIAQPMGNTWTSGSSNFAHDVYGDDPGAGNNSECDGWVSLAVADASVYVICREVSLRVVNGGQPYLTSGNHSALLMNKQFTQVVVPPSPPNCTVTGCRGRLVCCDCMTTNIRCTTKQQCDAQCQN